MEEPYIDDYASESIDAWIGAVGFSAVRTDEQWWLHQVSRGIKPIPGSDWKDHAFEQAGLTGSEDSEIPALAFNVP